MLTVAGRSHRVDLFERKRRFQYYHDIQVSWLFLKNVISFSDYENSRFSVYFHVQTPHHISKAFFAHTKVIVYDIHFNLCIILSSKDDILHEETWLLSRVSGVLGVKFWITVTQHTTDHKISKLSANCHHITRYHLLRFDMIYSHSPINAT